MRVADELVIKILDRRTVKVYYNDKWLPVRNIRLDADMTPGDEDVYIELGGFGLDFIKKIGSVENAGEEEAE